MGAPAGQKIRVVADTNILVSALLWYGTAKEVFVLAKKGVLTLCVTAETLEEFERVLHYPKFEAQLHRIHKTPHDVIDEFVEIVEYYPSIKLPRPYTLDDPTDDMFLACALSARASFIVSGDKHLLALKSFAGIPILNPRRFLKEIKAG